jgi:hypothetical protein
VVVCSKTVAGKLVVQWRGRDLEGIGQQVEVQAILDPADDSIEIVWGPNQQAKGNTSDPDGATAGVQNRTGDEATQIGANTAYATPNTSKKLTHP